MRHEGRGEEKQKRREIRENTPRITLLGPAGRPGQTGVGHSIPLGRATSQGNNFSWPHADHRPNEGQGFGWYFRTIFHYDQCFIFSTCFV